jgi:competence CoiA-like predicted nuclease
MFVALRDQALAWAKKATKDGEYLCPECGDRVILKAQNSLHMQAHFAHLASSSCAGLESDEHYLMKFWYVDQLETMGAEDIAYERRVYVDQSNWRQPDVAFTWQGKRYAIEIQRTQIPESAIMERTRDIILSGMERAFWVIDNDWKYKVSGPAKTFVGGGFVVNNQGVEHAPMPLEMIAGASVFCFCFFSTSFESHIGYKIWTNYCQSRVSWCEDRLEAFLEEAKAKALQSMKKIGDQLCHYKPSVLEFDRRNGSLIYFATDGVTLTFDFKKHLRKVLKNKNHICSLGPTVAYAYSRHICVEGDRCFVVSDMVASGLGLLKNNWIATSKSKITEFRDAGYYGNKVRRALMLYQDPFGSCGKVPATCESDLVKLRLGEARDHGFDSIQDLVSFKRIISGGDVYTKASAYLDDLFSWEVWVNKSHLVTRSDALDIFGVSVPVPKEWHQKWPNPLPSFLTMKVALLSAYEAELSK